MKRLFSIALLLAVCLIGLAQTDGMPDAERKAGLVEGYHGGVWSSQMRMDMIDLCSDLDVDSYVYAPKDDPYVGGSDWIMPYPQGRADDLKEVMKYCSDKGIEFVWCVRPDRDFDWSDEQYGLLLGKLEMMHYMGVRSFGVFFDGVPDYTESKAADMIRRIEEDFVARKKDVQSLVTDTDWCYVPVGGGESVKLGLYGIADYARDTDGYDPVTSLTHAVKEISGDAWESYLTYASHSPVAPDSFRIGESDGLVLGGLESLDDASCEKLYAEFDRIISAQERLSAGENKALYKDLEPWLVQFTLLGERCRRILDCVAFYRNGDTQGFWTTYAANLMSDEERTAYQAFPSGEKKLQPFYERMMTELFDAYKSKHKDSVGYTRKSVDGVEVFLAPEEASRCHLVLNNPQGREAIARLADTSGRYVAEFCFSSSYLEFELKDNAVRVEVLGGNEILEIVFVK